MYNGLMDIKKNYKLSIVLKSPKISSFVKVFIRHNGNGVDKQTAHRLPNMRGGKRK